MTKLDLKKINEEFYITNPTIMCYNNENPLIRFIENRKKSFITALVNKQMGELVLDVGCEAGHIIQGLDLKRRKIIVGLDIVKDALLDAGKICKGDLFQFILADASQLPFKSNLFNIIICAHLLEHVPKPKKVVVEIRRLISDKGILIVNVPNELTVLKIKRLIKRLGISLGGLSEGVAPGHLHIFTKQVLEEIISGYFEINQFNNSPFKFLSFDFIAVCKPI
jgi:ubiquinone/menaquinone biosynthesis C-methylase UbiE